MVLADRRSTLNVREDILPAGGSFSSTSSTAADASGGSLTKSSSASGLGFFGAAAILLREIELAFSERPLADMRRDDFRGDMCVSRDSSTSCLRAAGFIKPDG